MRTTSSATVTNGVMTYKVYPQKEGGKYISYTFTGTKDIAVLLENGKQGQVVSSTASLSTDIDYFLFKDVQITNGKAALDFRRSVPVK